MSVLDKYDRLAPGYAAHDYADPTVYSLRRARIATTLGPPLPAGATVLDLACGDANMAEPLLALGLRYLGVDGSPAMIAEARARLGGRASLEVALLDEYEPPEPVDMTLCLRAAYYAADRVAFFRRVAGYTRVKLVFDFRPMVHDSASIVADLRAAGFRGIELRPFLLPQSRRLPRAALPAVSALERTGPLASLVTRRYGRLFCAAWS
jgi:SAM-dependent methyltransferase